MLQILFEVCDLTRELALRGTVLGVFLLHFRQILQLDCLSLEDTALHVLDELLLLLTEEFVLQLHAMNFLFHSDNFCLADGGVECVLHFFLKLVLAFPKKNLLLSIDYIDQDIALLLLELRDLVLEFDGLILHLFELLLELHLNIEVVVGEFFLLFVVLVDKIVQFVHLKDLVFLGNLELADGFLVTLYLGIDSDFLLVEDGLLGSEVIASSVYL